MKRLMILVIGIVLLGSCSVTHKISETPTREREAIIYENKVVVITKTTLTIEEYNRLIATTTINRDNKNN